MSSTAGGRVSAPPRDNPLTAEEHRKSGVLLTPWLSRDLTTIYISIPKLLQKDCLPKVVRACRRAFHKQPQKSAKFHDEPMRGAERRGLGQIGDRGIVMAGSSVV